MKLLFTLLVLLSAGVLFAQTNTALWEDIEKSALPANAQPEKNLNLRHARSLRLDFATMRQLLTKAPMEHTTAAKSKPLRLELPMPDGSMQVFEIVESPVMESGLAAKFPEIKSFRGVSTSNNAITARIDVSPINFHAMIDQAGRTVFIDPAEWTNGAFYHAYYEDDVTAAAFSGCGNKDAADVAKLLESEMDLLQSREGNAGKLDLRTFRIAIATTGEYSQQFGGTISSVLASINTALNRLNQIYESEVGIRLLLMNNNDRIISLDPATDPYSDSSEGKKLLDQQLFIFSTVLKVPFSDFDLGHVFTAGCTDGVDGIAIRNSACTEFRAKGVTCFASNNVEGIAVRVFAHEVGHQFSAEHTFDVVCDPSNNNIVSLEPNCGTTIMAYGSITIPYFHNYSLAQIINYTRSGNASTCAAIIKVQNNEPEITHSYTDGFYIPVKTPFELTATATDADNDALSYSWEQLNTDKPLFRVFSPTDKATRIFPNLNAIINNLESPEEKLPDTTRQLIFRVTARDNHVPAGAAVWKEVRFNSTKNAGPFIVTYPNDSSIQWTAGSYAEIKWDVANTDKTPVNCKIVNIRLSTDGGLTYPILLAQQTPNTGIARVALPEMGATNRARIRVEAADNIFFDISNRNFQIWPAAQAGFTVDAMPRLIPQQCLPTPIQFNIRTDDVLGFNSPLTLSLEGSLPANTGVQFSKNPIAPSESATLTITFNQQVEGTFNLQLKATAASGTSQTIPISFSTVSNDFSQVVSTLPSNGQSNIGLSTAFTWRKSVNANTYDFELATSPAFGNTVIASASNLQDTTYRPTQILLEENRLYFWRIRPSNECGKQEFLEPSVFRTAAIQCTETASTNVPVNISGSGLPTINSTINVTTQGTINDINVPLIKANYQPVRSLRMTLISPAGTEVVLYDQNCGNTIRFETGFDDDAPSAIVCPPDDKLVVRPKEALAAFKGQNAAGTWTLRTRVVTAGFGGGGALESWNIEFCSTLAPTNPTVFKNDTLKVPPGQTNTYTSNVLEVRDSDNSAAQLTYLLVTLPKNGTLTLSGTPLQIGSTFTQQAVTNFQLKYTHSGSETTSDSFTFVVEDGTGGWLPSQRANIRIDNNATVGVNDFLKENSVLVFPNPAKEVINVQFEQLPNGALTLSLFNAQGQEVQRQRVENVTGLLQMPTSQLASGIYFLAVRTTEGIVTKKISVQR